jgi:hypothetical protein
MSGAFDRREVETRYAGAAAFNDSTATAGGNLGAHDNEN